MKKFVFFVVVLLAATTVSFAQSVGDYRTVDGASGPWNDFNQWEVYSGTWDPCGSGVYPGSTAGDGAAKVTIRNGSDITLTSNPQGIGSLVVESGAYLFRGATPSVRYITVNGNITCDGQIGNGTTFDGSSFNINGASCTISGSGQFDVAVIRKSGGVDTDLFINRNVNLRGAGTNFYNNGTGMFFTTISSGVTVTSYGDVSLDGTNGTGSADVINAITVDGGGTLTVSGTIYATTNNATNACNLNIDGTLNTSKVSRLASGTGRFYFTVGVAGVVNFTAADGGWIAYSSANNTETFNGGCVFNFIAAGNQTVAGPNYGDADINISGSETKTATGLTTTGDVAINGICTVNGGAMSVGTLTTASGTTLSASTFAATGTANISGSATFTGAITGVTTLTLAASGSLSGTSINTSSAITLNNSATFSLTLTTGTLNLNAGTLSCDAITVTTLTAAAGSTLIAAKIDAPGGTINISGAATITTDGIDNFQYLTLSSTGSLSGVSVSGDAASSVFTLNNSAAFSGAVAVKELVLTGSTVLDAPLIFMADNGKITIGGTASITPAATTIYASKGTLAYNGTTAQVTGNEFTNLGAFDGTLIIENNVSVTMTEDKVLKDVVFSRGNLITNGYTLTIMNTISNESSGSRIIGTVVTSGTTVEGANTFGGIGLTLNYSASALGIGDGITVTRINDATSGVTQVGGNSSVARKYVVTGSTSVPTSIDITWFPSEDNGKTLADMTVWGGKSPWVLIGTSDLAPISRSLNRTKAQIEANAGWTNINASFTVSNTGSPLPVELTSFAASVTGSKVLLNWATATEVDNYGFEIERSVVTEDARVWETIGFVEGNGNSNSPKEYSYADNSPFGGTTFEYRLKQIDNDGDFEYSEAVEAVIAPTEYSLEQNYPNPFNPSTTIRFSLLEKGMVKLTVYSILGEKVMEVLNKELEAGVHEVAFDASNLNSGVYVYSLQTTNFSAVKKMMLVK